MAARANLGYHALRFRAIRNSLPQVRTPTLLINSRKTTFSLMRSPDTSNTIFPTSALAPSRVPAFPTKHIPRKSSAKY